MVTSERFPPIPDEELITQLSNLAVDKQIKQIQNHQAKMAQQQSVSSKVVHFWKGEEGESPQFLLLKREEASYIVQHFDSHMGYTIDCLERVWRGESVKGRCNFFSLDMFGILVTGGCW